MSGTSNHTLAVMGGANLLYLLPPPWRIFDGLSPPYSLRSSWVRVRRRIDVGGL